MSGQMDGIKSAKKSKFTVYINEGEMKRIHEWVMQHPDIETGGDLFGLWIDESTAVVQFVLGPGKDCGRTTTSFFQNVSYLENAGSYLTKQHGLCNIGQWHSHHTIPLYKPSAGDNNTVWRNMPTLGMQRYIVLIANIIDDIASVNCFLFEIKNGKQLPVKKGCFEKLPEDSPFRLNSSVMEIVRNGAESLNDKDQLRQAADDLVAQDQTERSKTDIERNPGESEIDVIQSIDGEDHGAVSAGTSAAVSKETNDRRKNDNSGNITTITASDPTNTNTTTNKNNHNNNSDNTTISSTINTTNTTNNKSDNSTINCIINDAINTKDSRDNNSGISTINSTTNNNRKSSTINSNGNTTTNNTNMDSNTINNTTNTITTNNNVDSSTINNTTSNTITNSNSNNVDSSTINSTTRSNTINNTTNKKSETGQVLQNNDKRTKLKGIPLENGGTAFKTQGNESEKESTPVSQTPHEVKVSNSSAGSVGEGKHETKSEETITEQPQPTDHGITPIIEETRYTHQQSSSNNNTNNKSEAGQVLKNNDKRNNLEGSPQQNGGLGSESEKAPTSEKPNSSAASVGKGRYEMKSENAIIKQPHARTTTNHEISDSNKNNNNNKISKKFGCCGIWQVYQLSG